MSTEEVDAYVAEKLPPQHKDNVEQLRELVREHAPGATEIITYGSPGWRGNKTLAILSPTKAHVLVAFDRGVDFEDRHGLLAGVGKRSRHVKIKPGDTIDDEALADYIRQAVEHDDPS